MSWSNYDPKRSIQVAERWAGPDLGLGYLYRFEDVWYSVADEWGDHSYSRPELRLIAFRISKKTPKGWQIDNKQGGLRFIGEDWKKQYASPSIERALQGLIARKERQRQIHQARADAAKTAKEMGESSLLKYLDVKGTEACPSPQQ